jgi:hypothetical protein
MNQFVSLTLWLLILTAFTFVLAWSLNKWAGQFMFTLKNLIAFPPVVLDGLLYAFIAFFNALAAGFGSDEAAKYIEPATLFWLRTVCYVFGQTLLALKMFRSTTYADHRKGDTGGWRVIPETPPAQPAQPEKKEP